MDILHFLKRREVAARKVAEQKLLASEAKFHFFFEAAPQAILTVSKDSRILSANRRTEEMFGYARSELVGQPLEILLPERGHSDPKPHSIEISVELAGRRKDGSEFSVEVGLSGVPTEEGIVSMGVISDITERKRSERELTDIARELRRSNAELEQFTYVASHDLQEPLRMITSYLQLIERRYADRLDADGAEFIRYAVEGASRMKTLIQDLLRLSRTGSQSTTFVPVSGQVLLGAALQNLEVAIQESEAEVTADPLPQLVADAGLLTQVLQNLIGNAIKFQAQGVRPRIHVSASSQGGEWVFSVRDNGLGIEPQHRGRIFQIFERLHSADDYAGSGMGLAIAQRIVEKHGGRIWVESKPGEGSTFYFSIPVQVARRKATAG